MIDVQQALAAMATRVSQSSPLRRQGSDDLHVLSVMVGWALVGGVLCVVMIAAAALGDALAGPQGRHVGVVLVLALFAGCCWGVGVNLPRYIFLRGRGPSVARGLLRPRSLDVLAFGLLAAPVLLLLR